MFLFLLKVQSKMYTGYRLIIGHKPYADERQLTYDERVLHVCSFYTCNTLSFLQNLCQRQAGFLVD